MKNVIVQVMIVALLVVFLAIGCGTQEQQEPADSGPKEVDGVLLPDWAPENPSEAFLRTAKALKPLPDEFPDYTLLLRACYELFGTLSDEQIAEFLQPKQRSTSLEAAARNEGMRDFLEKQRGAEVVGDELIYKVNEISLPVKSLTPAQRAALENLIVEWGKEYVGTPDEDLLVSWYKMGAKEDLSNVTIRFAAMGHIVSLWYQIRTMSDQKIDQGTTRRTGVFGGRISEFAQL